MALIGGAVVCGVSFMLVGGGISPPAPMLVEFTIVTNAGNKTRARMAALIQQDLAQIGIEVRVVTLDFPSLIERITRTYQYDACLLGLVNVVLFTALATLSAFIYNVCSDLVGGIELTLAEKE